MSRSTTTRRLARTLFQRTTHSTTPRTLSAASPLTHSFSSSTPLRDDEELLKRTETLINLGVQTRKTIPVFPIRGPPAKKDNLWELSKLSQPTATSNRNVYNVEAILGEKTPSFLTPKGLNALPSEGSLLDPPEPYPEPYHFHVYAHKHNTHVTVTKPNREPIVSLSCGNLGFRKSARKHYDSAYQLGAYVIDKLQQRGLHNIISNMEVSLRGYGPGREAVTKVLMGTEGSLLRAKVKKVSDSTRLKFGGTRSKAPRRI